VYLLQLKPFNAPGEESLAFNGWIGKALVYD